MMILRAMMIHPPRHPSSKIRKCLQIFKLLCRLCIWRHGKLKIHLHENFIAVVRMLKVCLYTLKYFQALTAHGLILLIILIY